MTLVRSNAPVEPKRRQFLASLCAMCLPAELLRAGPADTPPLLTAEVACGIHVRRGVDEDVTALNGDGIANIGFVMGRDAVAVFDPGGSLADGSQLRARILQVTKLPIRYVVMSHDHPDHVFGAGAFVVDNPQFVGHAMLPGALAQRGKYYQQRLEAVLGAGNAGPIVVPSRLVQSQDRLELGGRSLLLTAHGIAHSDCDLSAVDSQTGALLTGDLLFVERVPSLQGSLKGWQAQLAALKMLSAKMAVPGHGPASVKWPEAARDLERYLNVLLRETRHAVEQRVDIETAVTTVGQSERGRWKLFDDYHGHNVIQAFKEVEWE
jgi:quinoprotein relay system zinc metallohydrolase 2